MSFVTLNPITTIHSLQNPRVKHVVKLQNRRYRDTTQQTVVEGVREAQLALENRFEPVEVFYCPDILDAAELRRVDARLSAIKTSPSIYEVNTAVFAKMAYRGTTGGILMVMPYWASALGDLAVSKRPFFAVIENVEKPGNLGAILRTADGVGVDGVIVCSDNPQLTLDLYNPNIIRASLGAIFTLPVVSTSSAHFIEWARLHKIDILVASPFASEPYTALDLNQPLAIVTGSEAFGLSEQMMAAADKTAVIPMNGQVDSLNLSVSTAVLLYEAYRQRTARRGG